VRALAERTQGFTAKGFLPARESGVHALKLESGSEILILLWQQGIGEYAAPEAKDSLTVAFGLRPTGAWDMLGEPLSLPAETGGKTLFQARPDPIYLVFPKTGSAIKTRSSRKARQPSSLSRSGIFDWGEAPWSAAGRILAP